MFALDAEHTLRLLRADDGAALARGYSANRAHLEPWEPLRPASFFTAAVQDADVRRSLAETSSGRAARFVVEGPGGEIRGRFNLNGIVRGAFDNADLGYWVDARLQGRGIATAAVAHVLGYACDELRLHRVQAGNLVHNVASQRVLAANGFTRIGLATRYLRIAGEWQDHILFQRLLEERISAASARP